MKEQDIRSRETAISQRAARIRSARQQDRRLRGIVSTPYYADGLAGVHPFREPAVGREQYLERHERFAAPVQERLAALVEESRSLPVLERQRWDERRDVRIGIIADRFLVDSLEDAAHLVPLAPDSPAEEIAGLDLLLITSSWRGLAGEWTGLGTATSPARRALEERIVPLAREHGIPVAYYSKEDPAHHGTFSSLAPLADHVFTTAVESVPDYREALGPEVPVDVLPFAVNYRRHNPLGSMRHEGREALFAGSWFAHRYPERRRAAQNIFDGVLDAGAELLIVDRNLELDPEEFGDAERYLFPEKYLPHLHGPVDHDVLLGVQRLLPLGINLNSVIDSASMHANRVIELQAMGTLVISNYAVGVNSLYPQVAMPDSRRDVELLMRAMTRDSIRAAQAAGIRSAFVGATAFDRVDALLGAMGIAPRTGSAAPDHRVLVTGIAREDLPALLAQQTLDLPVEHVAPEDVAALTGSSAGDVLVDLAGVRAGEAGPNLLRDLVTAFRYSDADVIAARGLEHDGPLYEPLPLGRVDGGITAAWLEPGQGPAHARRDGAQGLAIIAELPAPRSAALAGQEHPAREPELTIIVPTFDNGPHLRFKCFESIRRSSIADRARVLIVDDGSTDPETRWIIEDLAARHRNVELFRFPEGGSGSASRPRNQGLALARTPYVTYLDPDNELTNDGYARLLEVVGGQDLDFAIGDIVRARDKRVIINNSRLLRQALAADGTVAEDALARIRFQPMSIQAMVADTAWLQGLGLEQPVGAVGQDSFFFQQMLHRARRAAVLPLPIHVYYAAVANSVVNTVGPRFYERYLPLEELRSAWLEESGLMDSYLATRLEPYVKGWYVQKLEEVAPSERAACRELIGRILALYPRAVWTDPELAGLAAEQGAPVVEPAAEPVDAREDGEPEEVWTQAGTFLPGSTIPLQDSLPTRFDMVVGDVVVPMLLRRSAHHPDRLVVALNGAVSRSAEKSPSDVFQRRTWMDDIPASVLYIADPTLRPDNRISIGWGQGEEGSYAIPAMAQAARAIGEMLGVDPGRRLYFGSSAGGFQAMQLAARDAGARALVNNAQFDWTRYAPANVRTICRHSYGGLAPEQVAAAHPGRTSVVGAFLELGNVPRTRYLLNAASPADAEDQMPALVSALAAAVGTEAASLVDITLYVDTAAKHAPLPRRRTLEEISRELDLMDEDR